MSEREGEIMFHVDGPITERERETKVYSLDRGIQRVKVSAGRAEGAWWCLEMDTVTEIRRGRYVDMFKAQCVYLVLYSL